MKSILRLLALIILCVVYNLTGFAQNYTVHDFYKVDSIAKEAQPKDALALINKINLQARTDGNSALLIKSVIYRMMFQSYLEENAFDKILIDLRKDISTAKQPEKSILQSLLAESYWKFYQQNQWKIIQRTNVQGNIGDDINTWSTRKLIEEITKTYLASLSEPELLQQTKVDFLDHVLAGDKYNRNFRPTLYDLLAHRAIDVFTNTQIALTQAEEESLNFNDPIWFAERNVFLNIQLPKNDSSSFYISTLQIFKNLLKIKPSNEMASADADLRRLKFISLRNDDKQQYFKALETLANQTKNNEVYADILFEQASLYKNNLLPDSLNQHLIKAVNLANRAVIAYPKSIGAQNASNMILGIKYPELGLQTKANIEPHKAAQLLITYKNLDTVYFKLYKRPIDEQTEAELDNKEDLFKFLTQNKHLKKWFIVVPNSKDFRSHTLVTKIDGLDFGKYLLIAQNTNSNESSKIINYTNFTVTNLAVTDRLLANNMHEYNVANHTTGAAIKGAKIQQRKYNNKGAFTNLQLLTTNELGSATTDEIQDVSNAIIYQNKDSLNVNISNYNYRANRDADLEKVILFTDRPIYRPGQTIFYKGLFIGYKNDKNTILPGEEIDITFEDVNGKEIEEKTLKTNEFGTFQGSFVIPMGKLNGQMELQTAYGSIKVQVEEYKRPTFEVAFDELNGRYKLNDSVNVSGKAMAFAGYSVNSAKVSYKIFRRAIYDYRINYYDNNFIYGSSIYNRQQIAFGNTITKDGGKWDFNFLAKTPNEKFNFAFDIEITITDLNGETRTKSTSINIGKKDMALSVANDQIIFLTSKETKIPYHVSNLNNIPINATLTAEWFLLETPNRLTNKSPFYAENYTYSKDEFIKIFPTDDYNNEFDLAKWSISKNQLNQNSNADKGKGAFIVNHKDLIAGYYKVKFTAKNEANDTLNIEKYVIVYTEKPAIIKTNTEWIVAETNLIEPNESAVFRLAGLTPNSLAFYEIYYKNNIVEKVLVKISPKQTIIKIPAKANFEDAFAVQFTMISNGTTYNSLQNIYINNLSKQLDVKFLTFRDKLQPGEKESWKLQISNKNGEREMAEMVATLYDASLNDFRQMSWSQNLRNTYNYQTYVWRFNNNQLAHSNEFWFTRNHPYYGVKVRQYETLNLFGYNYYGGNNYNYRNYLQNIQNRPMKGLSAAAEVKLKELANDKVLHGVVFDNQGYVVPGAIVKFGKISTSTNYLGIYTINAKAGDELTITSLGYKILKQKVGQKKRLDFNLFPDGNALNEVVVTGYGSVSKKEMTGAVSTVQSQDIRIRGTNSLPAKEARIDAKAVVVEDNTVYNFVSMNGYDPKTGIQIINGKPIYKKPDIIPRTNFKEIAFFYPQLKTNEKGEINIEFTIPQSLTRYKMMGFAHTKDLKTATMSNELITQKQLAISANTPRFFREGDTILFSAKLNNLSGKSLKGDALLELKNALTGKPIQILALNEKLNQNFELENDGNSVLKWNLIIPTGISAVTYKIVAQSGKFSDGEEMTIPVLPNTMLVTESMPINVRANTSKTFTMDKLLNSGSSTTLRNQALTFEFTANPVWYAIQALPYLMEYPYECAEQTFSRFYANSFATGIINSSPKIADVFKQWQSTNNGEAFLSNLEKNPELKSILLEETPWVRNANNETERKKRLANLFDLNRMTYELKSNFEKLEKMQYADGSFPWFTGMEGNRYITQHIVLGIGQLKKLKLIDEKAYPNLNIVLNKAIIYLDKQLVNDYKNELSGKRFGYLPLHYLFARSYTNQINKNTDFTKAKEHYTNKIATNWKTFDSYQLAQTALVLHRNGNKIEPAKIITLLKQTAQQSDEMGMYWAKNTSGWWWYQNPIETQSLLIEAFDEVAADNKAVEEMKIWLLKNKQTNDWKTTKATAAACYALLMKGYDILSENKDPEIKIGNQTIAQLGFANSPKEAGTGYQKININGADIKPEMAKVEIKNNNKSIAWGALYWQYFEQLDKITPANTGVKIKKQLFIQNTTVKGNLLTPLTPTNVLKPGDLLKVRIEIYSDRDMEYIHLKDMRSSSFEPVNVISRYKYQDGLGYYESTKDASTNFFISYLRKGTYVFEYELRVTHSGNFSNGITTLQSMYAPEFTTHSEGVRVMVK